jgi:hypothetical protein
MKYTSNIQAFSNSPDDLESLYQSARQANEEAEFRSDLQEVSGKSPENILLSAWNARFTHMPLLKAKRTTNWLLAVILGLVTGAILFSISGPSLTIKNGVPYIVLLWAPIATIPTLIFLAVVSKRNYLYTGLTALALIALSIYSLLMTPGLPGMRSNDYLILMLFLLPLLCWIGLGVAVLKFKSSTSNRFAFMIKSIEVMITAGIYLIAGVAFGMITIAMFAALNVTLSDVLMRLAVSVGFGLIPIMAVATMYDPLQQPEAQDFSQGLSKFIFTMMRLLLPLTLIVLVIYLFAIPFNFMAPFQNRNLLIVYNVMQFAIIGLLIGATPLKLDDLSEKLQTWLRRGILAVAILALLVSLYAFSAVVYRTVGEFLTLNRLTIIGWNIINIAILFMLIYTQFVQKNPAWNERLQNIFSKATTVYLVWSVFLTLALPLIFR